MNYRLDVGMWNQVFAVPCALVDRHLKLAGKEQLQAILWTLRHPGESFSPADMAQALGMSTNAAMDAMEYWCDRGLLCTIGGELSPAPQPEPLVPTSPGAVQEDPSPRPEAEPPQEKEPERKEPEPEPQESQRPALPPKKRMLRPDGEHLAARMAESEAMRFLMQEAEAALGKTLSPAMSALLVTITDDYGLPVEVTVMLLHYVVEVGRIGTSYIDSVARDWAESGIFSLEAAEAKLQALSQERQAWRKVYAVAGLDKRNPGKKEGETAARWVYQWKFDVDMLSEAYEACVNHTGKFKMSYMDKILEGWHQRGIRTPEQARAEQEKYKTKKKKTEDSGKSYDIDQLEEMSSFLPPEEL